MSFKTGEVKHYFENVGTESAPMFKAVDFSFVNTSLFTEAGDYFNKHKDYEYPIPKDFSAGGAYDRWVKRFREGTLSKDEMEYWRLQDYRMKYGMKAPGMILPNGKVQEVEITGQHYWYLNFMPMMRSVEKDNESSEQVIQRFLGRKKDLEMPAFWDGDFYLFHAKALAWELGKHFIYAKARRKGASHKEAADTVYTAHTVEKSISVLAAYQGKFLYGKGRGLYVLAKNYIDFINTYTVWRKSLSRARSDGSGVMFGKKTIDGRTIGFGSEIYALSFHNDPDAGIGDDVYRLKIEEAEKFPNLEDSLDVMLPALEDGAYLTGQATIYGTAGTKDANWEYFEKICLAPEIVRAITFENVWDEDALGTGSAFFFPYIQNLVPYMDKEGNSDKTRAKIYSDAIRNENKKTAKPDSHRAFVAQRANNFEEAFSRVGTSILPKELARQQNLKIQRNKDIQHMIAYGQILETDKGLKFIRNDQLEKGEVHDPCNEYPHKESSDLHGCITQYYVPYYDNQNTIPINLYGAWIDPPGIINDGNQKSKKLSLGACYIFETPNNFTSTLGNRIVASFIGRGNDKDPNSFNKICLSLCRRYNCIGNVLFENNRGTIKDYCTNNKLLVYLMPTPNFQLEQEVKFVNTQKYGLTMTAQIIDIGLLYFKKWLEEPVGMDKEGNDILRIHTIYDIGLLNEIEKFDGKKNVDRIRACIVGMFQKEQNKYNEIRTSKRKTDGVLFSSATLRYKNSPLAAYNNIIKAMNKIKT